MSVVHVELGVGASIVLPLHVAVAIPTIKVEMVFVVRDAVVVVDDKVLHMVRGCRSIARCALQGRGNEHPAIVTFLPIGNGRDMFLDNSIHNHVGKELSAIGDGKGDTVGKVDGIHIGSITARDGDISGDEDILACSGHFAMTPICRLVPVAFVNEDDVGIGDNIVEVTPSVSGSPTEAGIGEIGVAVGSHRPRRHGQRDLVGMVALAVADAAIVEAKHIVIFPHGWRSSADDNLLQAGQTDEGARTNGGKCRRQGCFLQRRATYKREIADTCDALGKDDFRDMATHSESISRDFGDGIGGVVHDDACRHLHLAT